MSTPVLIAARNEAERLGPTLAVLPRSVEPIVITNGDDAADNQASALIAESFGAMVFHCPEQGKLPALQAGIQYLGGRATEPFITLDANSRPLVPRHWLESLANGRRQLEPAKPAIVIGPYIFTHDEKLTAAGLTAQHLAVQLRHRHSSEKGRFSGGNALLDLRHQVVVNSLLALPNIWAGEDVAIKDKVVSYGGNSLKTPSPLAAVVKPAHRYPSLKLLLKEGRAAYSEAVRLSYRRDAPPGSRPYDEIRAAVALDRKAA